MFVERGTVVWDEWDRYAHGPDWQRQVVEAVRLGGEPAEVATVADEPDGEVLRVGCCYVHTGCESEQKGPGRWHQALARKQHGKLACDTC